MCWVTGWSKLYLFSSEDSLYQPAKVYPSLTGLEGSVTLLPTLTVCIGTLEPPFDSKVTLHTACADFVFDLPEGIDTELGERGSGLSEGQAQRIAIARGLLHDGDILLLDEISSSLDEPTERELYSRLFASFPRKTMLFITHRNAVSTLCDEVIKL